MLTLAIALAMLQAPKVKIVSVWETNSEPSSTASAVLIRHRGGGQFVFLRPTVGSADKNEHDWCVLDSQTGKVSVVQTLKDEHGGTPQFPNDLKWSLDPIGELRIERWNGSSHRLELSRGARSVDFIEDANHYMHPVDDDQAMKTLLPPMLITARDVGNALVLSDGDRIRLLAVNGEVRSYEPKSWSLDQTLLQRDALASSLVPFFSTRLVGNPQKDAFVIVNGDNGVSTSAFFARNLTQLDVPATAWCYDARYGTFLVAEHANSVEQQTLECIDAVTGVRKWVRSDVHSGAGPAYIVGDYAVCVSRTSIDARGALVKILSLLDAETGKTVAEQMVPMNYSLWEHSGLKDMIILTDENNNYYGYRIVVG